MASKALYDLARASLLSQTPYSARPCHASHNVSSSSLVPSWIMHPHLFLSYPTKTISSNPCPPCLFSLIPSWTSYLLKLRVSFTLTSLSCAHYTLYSLSEHSSPNLQLCFCLCVIPTTTWNPGGQTWGFIHLYFPRTYAYAWQIMILNKYLPSECTQNLGKAAFHSVSHLTETGRHECTFSGCDAFSWLQGFLSTPGRGNWRRRLLAVDILFKISFQPWKRDQRCRPGLPAQAFVSTFPLQLGTKRRIFCIYYHRLWSNLVDVDGTLFTVHCRWDYDIIQ